MSPNITEESQFGGTNCQTVSSTCGQEASQPLSPCVPGASTPSSLRNWMRVVVPLEMRVLPVLDPNP